MSETTREAARISRRNLLKAGGALAVGAHLPGPWVSPAAAQAAPLRLGFQVHRTGIGAVYGRWYERTTAAPRFGSVPSSSATISTGRPPMPPFSLMSFTAAVVVRSYQRP